jgi:ribosomal protein L11 methylase PrmA
MQQEILNSSFRDPSGFVFSKDGGVYRQINKSYQEVFELFESSGLYEKLVKDKKIVAHSDASISSPNEKNAFKVVKPDLIPFISYPYEWSFSQLKDAALLTLKIQKISLAHGMTLKDASSYNVQFVGNKPIFIDTLSFEKYEAGNPWVAYKQFCQHFLAPLMLMAKVDVRLLSLCRNYIDGIPLDLTAKLLPRRTKFSMGCFMHIHLHSKAQNQFSDAQDESKSKKTLSENGMKGLVDNLSNLVKGLEWKPGGTEWGDYYEATNYTDDSFEEKKIKVRNFIGAINPAPKLAVDLGANDGTFSSIAQEVCEQVVAADIDPTAVEKNYRRLKKNGASTLLPLLLDLTNPTPNSGWANNERDSFFTRAPVDLVLSLALIHHLVISNNVPISKLAKFYSEFAPNLIIEFVPKEDSQVRRLLISREDIFPDYTLDCFREEFSKYFEFVKEESISGTERTLCLLKRK